MDRLGESRQLVVEPPGRDQPDDRFCAAGRQRSLGPICDRGGTTGIDTSVTLPGTVLAGTALASSA
jgi:hypothetical protein